jgi:uridylate kinase
MPESSESPWNRVVLKLSGEAFASSSSEETIDGAVVERIAGELAEAGRALPNLQIAVVIGGGNIWRGATGAGAGMDRATADYMGMLATVINAMALQDALERQGQATRVLSAIHMAEVAEPYIRRRAIRHLEKRRVVVFAGGTGNPFFTTDTTASLRAAEIEAQAVLKGTHVDGVYDDDPKKNPKAKRFAEISFKEVLERDLKVMDLTAVTLCKDNDVPIFVFDVMTKGNIGRALAGEPIGTLVR